MTPYVAAESFLGFNAKRLGQALYDILQEPRTRQRVMNDFPHVLEWYKTPEAAKRTVKQRQRQIRRDPKLQTLVAIAGKNEDDAKIWGVVSLVPANLPGTNTPGLNVAAWLSASRDATLKGLASRLVQPVIELVLYSPFYTGDMVIWTLARPEHPFTNRFFGQQFGKLRFSKYGLPKAYPELDGVTRQRQLYVSPSLGELA